MDWLDTETKAILQKQPPDKQTAIETGEFSLVLIKVEGNATRLVRATQDIRDCTAVEATEHLGKGLPLIVASGLSHADALLGQFEYVCCDATSIFVRDEVAHGGHPDYLNNLYMRLQHGDEWRGVTVHIRALPNDYEGRQYLEKFTGRELPKDVAFQGPMLVDCAQKKARIMEHWAHKIGGFVDVRRW